MVLLYVLENCVVRRIVEKEDLFQYVYYVHLFLASSVASVRVGEALAFRAGTRVSTDGTKPKITSPKENWHG